MKKTKKEVLKEKKVNPESAMKEAIHEKIDDLKEVLDVIKLKYDKADEKTKSNIIFGVFGFLSFITGVISARSSCKKNKKQQ